MDIQDINMEEISQILSSLSDDDVEQLKGVAASFFPGSGAQEAKKAAKPPQSEESGEQLDFESMKKIMEIMKLLKSDVHDPRCDLLYALKPMLKKERRQRVDQAAKMLQLLSVLPRLRELGI